LIACGLAGASVAPGQSTWYVDDDAAPGGLGTSWSSPFDDLQDALDVAGGSDSIHVAGGTYVPSALYDPNDPSPIDPRNATFRLVASVGIYGGYAGAANPGDPGQRDIDAYETILSGDLAGNDGPDFANNEENSYHVVYAFGPTVTARLDGLTLTAGNANHPDAPHRDGGGITVFAGAAPTFENCTLWENAGYMGAGLYINASTPTVTGCVFEGNVADWGGGANNSGADTVYTDCVFTGNASNNDGGGMRNVGGANPSVTDCAFSNNSATASGGGLTNVDTCNPTLVGCDFSNNQAVVSGGAVINTTTCSPTLVDCTFTANTTDGFAGGVHNTINSSPTLINCVFDGNSALDSGGAMLCHEYSNAVLTNCLFVDNGSSANGGAIVARFASDPVITNSTFSGNTAGGNGGGVFVKNTAPTFTNCVIWGDTPQAVYNDGGSPVITYSDIEGGWAGTGNIDADPGLTASHQLSAGSPCIDAGNNTAVPADVADLDDDGDTAERTPLDLEYGARFLDDPDVADTGVPDPEHPEVVDMGADEYEAQECFGDLDGDNDIDLADLAQLLGNYGETSGMTYEDGDLDGDGDVDLSDLAGLLGVYGTTCP
jgi:hypothetical protein